MKTKEEKMEKKNGRGEEAGRVFFAPSPSSSLSSFCLDRIALPMCSGIGTSLLPRHLSSVDLPQPLGPMRPYRLLKENIFKVLSF